MIKSFNVLDVVFQPLNIALRIQLTVREMIKTLNVLGAVYQPLITFNTTLRIQLTVREQSEKK